MREKYCGRCRQTKPIDAFGKCHTYKDGLTYYCRQCTREQRYQYQQANPEHFRTLKREHQKRYWSNRQHKRYFRMRDNAKRKGIPFQLIKEKFTAWFEQQEQVCGYCGQRLENGKGSMVANSLNVDRKDNRQGYTVDNIILACRRCNSIKGDWLTYEQMKEIALKYFPI